MGAWPKPYEGERTKEPFSFFMILKLNATNPFSSEKRKIWEISVLPLIIIPKSVARVFWYSLHFDYLDIQLTGSLKSNQQ